MQWSLPSSARVLSTRKCAVAEDTRFRGRVTGPASGVARPPSVRTGRPRRRSPGLPAPSPLARSPDASADASVSSCRAISSSAAARCSCRVLPMRRGSSVSTRCNARMSASPGTCSSRPVTLIHPSASRRACMPRNASAMRSIRSPAMSTLVMVRRYGAGETTTGDGGRNPVLAGRPSSGPRPHARLLACGLEPPHERFGLTKVAASASTNRASAPARTAA